MADDPSSPAPSKTAQEIEKRLAVAQEKVRQLKAAQAAQKARDRARQSKAARAADTRRKILLGSYLLRNTGPDEIKTMMAGYLADDRDRELFGLEPLRSPGTQQNAPLPTHDAENTDPPSDAV